MEDMHNLKTKNYRLKTKQGFTLIEIIVVIAVIGILSLVIMASMDEARKKSRDTARISDIQQISAALQVYGATFGRYPETLSELVDEGMYAEVPEDPINEDEHVYRYDNDCASPSVNNNTLYYRVWTIGEREQSAEGWSDSKTIGATNCTDPQ